MPPTMTTFGPLMRIEITGTGGDYDGLKGWAQQVSAKTILDVLAMKTNSLRTGSWLIVWDDGTSVSFPDYDTMWENFYEGGFVLLP